MRQRTNPMQLSAFGVACLMFIAGAPNAGAEHYYFRLYTAADGLSQAVVQSVYQDRTGYLWIGTQAGLNKYDGASVTVYGVRHGLASDSISGIAQDQKGRIWLATLNGVSVWNGKNFLSYAVEDGLADNRVVALAVGRDNLVWCATPHGVSRYDGRKWRTFTTADGLPSNNINTVLADSDGRLWAATATGLARLDGERFLPFDPQQLTGKNIRVLAVDGDHRLWIGLDDSLRIYDRDRLIRVYTQTDGLDIGPLTALCIDRHGIGWLGTPRGLGYVRDGKITVINAAGGLAYNDVRCLFEDGEGVLWIGVYGGLYKFQGRAFTNYDMSDGLGANSVRPVLRDRKGFLWAGTTGGLSRFDGRNWKTFTVADGLSDNAIHSLLESRDGRLWIGTGAGLTVYDGSRFIKDLGLPVQGRVSSIAEDHSGTIWCAGMLGALFCRIGEKFEPVSVDGQSFPNSRLLVDYHGWIWASGDHGLSRWDGRSWQTLTTKDGLASNQPYFLCSDQSGRIWFGYHSSNGLSSFDGIHFEHYTSTEGLANDAVYSLGIDRRGRLWVGTARGVDRFDGQSFTHFGSEDGYANEESNAGGFFADSDDTLWFGTLGGLSHYDPRFDPSTGEAPRVELTEIHLGPQQFFPTDAPSVSYRMNDLLAHIAGLSFVNEGRVGFQYRLKGLSEDWLPLQGREIRITNLPSRQYTLEVRARKYQGPWSEPVRFGFKILTPFWLQWWFWLLSAGLILASLSGGLRIQSARTRRKAQELETMVAARTRELEQKKEELESFIYTISHDLKAPVVSLQGLANLLQLDLGDRINGDAAFYLERIQANTVQMQLLINQLLNLSRIGRLKEPQLPVDMKELTREAINDLQGQIELKKARISIADDLPVLLCERDRFKQVMVNLLSNAIHYSRPDVAPVIEIGVRKDHDSRNCTLFVRDNGIGITKEHLDRVFDIFYRVDGKYADSESTGVGLAIVKRVINSHGGNVWVESEGPGSGSTFYVSLPSERMQKQ